MQNEKGTKSREKIQSKTIQIFYIKKIQSIEIRLYFPADFSWTQKLAQTAALKCFHKIHKTYSSMFQQGFLVQMSFEVNLIEIKIVVTYFVQQGITLFILILHQMSNNLEHESEEMRMKRASKIPLSLKSAFLHELAQSKHTIKKVASQFGINYSTAKAIVKENKKFIHDKSTRESESDYSPLHNERNMLGLRAKSLAHTRCSYKEIKKGLREFEEGNNFIKKQDNPSQIEVVSTVAWDFLRKGLPKKK